ncbi:hypothetical protein [Desulfovibrio psychrotolerans]|uniref:Uncharacterized protein n=1 Tax=Desulfovibrio psychrotolerans TaxID=415242 RepID=A0A7J0BSR0_9BACT|nr:hypothetical protein [Desulfovibrio psychrotolerans]GFM36747.1 hypothetical protein DSM19430T_14310 [Desulfovibrio psychrotolerans]
MSSPNAAELLPDNIPALQEFITSFDRQLQELDAELKRLFAMEDPAKGIFFSQEIHLNRQQKNQLQVHRQFAQVRLNRLRLEASPF